MKPKKRIPLRVFIVENHQDTLDTLTNYLQSRGHTVFSAHGMHEALEKIPVTEFDVLFSDLALLDGTGWQMMNEIRLRRPVFAVAMSGFNSLSDRIKSEGAGFRHHLAKPVPPEKIEQMLEEARSERDIIDLRT